MGDTKLQEAVSNTSVNKTPNRTPNKTPNRTPNRTPKTSSSSFEGDTNGKIRKMSSSSSSHGTPSKSVSSRNSIEMDNHIKQLISSERNGNVTTISSASCCLGTNNSSPMCSPICGGNRTPKKNQQTDHMTLPLVVKETPQTTQENKKYVSMTPQTTIEDGMCGPTIVTHFPYTSVSSQKTLSTDNATDSQASTASNNNDRNIVPYGYHDIERKKTLENCNKLPCSPYKKTPKASTSSSNMELDSVKETEVKEQVKSVVGDLENVLGELKTVVGDLKTLVDQIDVVTTRIDEEYGTDWEDEETLPKLSIVESKANNNNNNTVIVRSTRTHNLGLINPLNTWTFFTNTHPHLLAPEDELTLQRRRLTLLHLQSTEQSKDFEDSEFLLNDLHKNSLIRKNVTRLNNVMDADMNKRKGLLRSSYHPPLRRQKCFEVSDDQLVWIPRFVEGSCCSKSLSSLSSCDDWDPSQDNTSTPSFSTSPDPDYCGIYEKELDLKLENDLEDEHMTGFNESFDDNPWNSFEFDDYRVFNTNYARVSRWASFTVNMVHSNSFPLSDDMDYTPSDTPSDILNDNIPSSALDSPGTIPYGFPSPVGYTL